MKKKQSSISFAYVYVVYYYDVDVESRAERLRQVQPMVCSSMRRCMDLIRLKGLEPELQEINSGQLWRAGNYWIQREPIIDSYDMGLEYEVMDSYGVTKTGRMPLKFEDSTS